MRILQVSPYFSPQMGGSPQVVYQISRELANRGHDVTVVAGNYGIHKAAFPPGAFQLKIIPTWISKWGFDFTPGLFTWAQNHIKDFDIIHLHEARTFQNIVMHSAAVRSKVPYVLSAHGTLPVVLQRQSLKKLYDFLFGRAILCSSSHMIAVSQVEADQYRQAGVEDCRIRVIYNGLDLNEFQSLPAPGAFRKSLLKLGDKTKIVLFLGRLHKIKSIGSLIEAFSQLTMDSIRSHLVIAGPDAGELLNLRNLVKHFKLENRVSFIGPLYGEDKIAALVDADILVYPGKHEIFGIVPFEAIMCGTPVIVSDDSGLGQLISESKSGYLTPNCDVSALSEKMRYVLTNPEDAKQKVKTGRALIQSTLNWQTIGNALEQLYYEIVNPKAKP